MTEQNSVSALEERIARLERSVYDDEPSNCQVQCIETLINVQNRIQSAVTGREKITTVFSKLEDLENYLNPEFRENVNLTETVKANLVLLDEERIRNAVDSLQTVKDLSQYLDSEHIRAAPSLYPKLTELSKLQIKQQEDVMAMTNETRNLIADYNELITSLSKQFILWDSVVTEAEKDALKKKGTKC